MYNLIESVFEECISMFIMYAFIKECLVLEKRSPKSLNTESAIFKTTITKSLTV